MENKEFEKMCQRAGIKKDILCDTIFTRQFKKEDTVMNKGKKEIRLIGGKKYVCYKCKRCGVIIPEEYWNKDRHKNCDEYFKTKAIRERVEKRVLGIF